MSHFKLLVFLLFSTISLVLGVLPTFPNNLVLFPNRDFITIEGYADRIGRSALIQVHRGGAVVGSAVGVVSGTDVAFEINHPGGVCWGAGTNLKVTPDLQPGDRVSISFDGVELNDAIVQNAFCDKVNYVDGAKTFTVTGFIAADINRGNTEQRIIVPELKDTTVGRRDVRALPGPLALDGSGAYSSGVTFDGNTFTARYEFTDATLARIAANGAARFMTWQSADGAGNRQGLTIAELGEVGGPGMGGCPAGPADVGAPVSNYAIAFSTDKKSADVVWIPITSLPGSPPVTGYDVTLIATAVNGIASTFGARTNTDTSRVTIRGLDANTIYTVEVRSVVDQLLSVPFTLKPDLIVVPIPPTLVITPTPLANGNTEASTVSAQSNGIIYYTLGTASVITGDQPSDVAILYTGPIPITTQTTINFAAFSASGLSKLQSATFVPPGIVTPPPPPVIKPVAPSNVVIVPGRNSAVLTWSQTPTDATITTYRISLFDGVTSTVIRSFETTTRETNERTVTLSGLEPSTRYAVSMASKNGAGTFSDETSRVIFTTLAPLDVVTITTARWDRGDFRVTGDGSQNGVTVTVYSGTATAIGGIISGGTATVVTNLWSVRIKTLAVAPEYVYVKSSAGGVAGPFVVSIRR